MERSLFRMLSAIVAWVDMMVTYLNALLLLLVYILFPRLLESIYSDSKGPVNYKLMPLFFLLCVLILGIQLLAACKLLAATKDEMDPSKALKEAGFWKAVSIVFLALAVVGIVIGKERLAIFIIIVWRGASIYIVCQFMNELEAQVVDNSDLGNFLPMEIVNV